MFSVIVVPWHSVIAEESKEFLPILLKTLPALRGHLALPLSREEPLVEPLHIREVLPQEVVFQTTPINGIYNRPKYVAKLLHYLSQFIIVRALQHVVV